MSLATPASEATLRDELIAGLGQSLDTAFVDPSLAGLAGEYPASVTNGITPIAASGSPRTDVLNLIAAFANAGQPLANAVFVLGSLNAAAAALAENSDGVGRLSKSRRDWRFDCRHPCGRQ